MYNTYDILIDTLKRYSIENLAGFLGVATGTIKRWLDLKNIPTGYHFELCRLSNIDIDYTKFAEVDKDQFFTDPGTAQYCVDKMIDVLSSMGINTDEYSFIEPSAGDGSFYKILPHDRTTAMDIEPRYDGINKKNFLSWKPHHSKNICIGNPPFGLRGNLALKFINHASTFCDFICFILPPLFNSNGKGSCKNRLKHISLIYSEKVDPNFHYPNGDSVKVNTIFQIWSTLHKPLHNDTDTDKYIKLYSLSDGGTPSTTRNKKLHHSCDYYLPSTCFGDDKVRLYDSFDNLPQRRGYGIVVISDNDNDKVRSVIENMDWSDVSFKSTNGSCNLRFDLIKKSINDKIIY